MLSLLGAITLRPGQRISLSRRADPQPGSAVFVFLGS